MSKPRTKHDDTVRVIQYHKDGLKPKEIAEKTGVKQRTVYNLVRKFEAEGGDAVPSHGHGGGRPRKITKRGLGVLKRQLRGTPTLTARKLKEHNPLLLGETSIRTIQESLHREGYRKKKCLRKPLLTKAHRKKRRAFALNYKGWGLNEWREVLWSDEATFFVSDAKGKTAWRAPDDDPLSEKLLATSVKYPPYIMVWGSFGYGGLGELVILPRNETVNKEVYYTLLNLHLESSFEKSSTSIFQQDGAPAHTSKFVTSWLEDCSIDYIKDWPGNSPDLSPIENLWAIIKAHLRDRDTSTIAKLEVAVRECWDALDPEILRNLADSVPKRLRKCLSRKRKSDVTKY